MTVLLAVRISRTAQTTISATRAMRRAGVLLAIAMLTYAIAAGLPTGTAVSLLLLATAVYTVGDLLHATASTCLAYDLAQPHALGQYQGASGLVTGLGHAVGPAILTVLLLDGRGRAGWAALGALFLVTGLIATPLTRWALTNRQPANPAEAQQG